MIQDARQDLSSGVACYIANSCGAKGGSKQEQRSRQRTRREHQQW